MRARHTRLFLLVVLAAAAFTSSQPASAAPASERTAGTENAARCSGPCPVVVFAKGTAGGTIEAVTVPSAGTPTTESCSLARGEHCTFFIDEFAFDAYLRATGAGSVFRGYEGDNICIRRTPDRCYVSPGQSGAVCAIFTVTSSEPVPQSSCPPPFIQAYKKGDGKGTLTATAASAAPPPCGPSCPAVVWTQFAPNDVVTLTAQASEGSFVGWEQCPDVQGPACRVTLTNVTTVCAVFVRAVPPTSLSCPATTPPRPPPPPPPSGPPKVGSRCTIFGSGAGDVIRGTSQRDVICGRGGNDRIYGGAGHDLILGGPGNDKIYGQAGRDHVRGEAGTDLLDGGASDDTVAGGTQADTIYARDGIRDTVNGGTGKDRGRLDRADRRASVERRF